MNLDEIYKRELLGPDIPRRGDLAEVIRDHHRTETGLLVQVMNDPHRSVVYCHECGQEIVEHIVEVHSNNPAWQDKAGPWFYPIRWLKRIDPTDPLQYKRINNYRPIDPMPAQIIAANK